MNIATASIYIVGLFFCISAYGQNLPAAIDMTPSTPSPDNNRLAIFRELKIEAGTITSVERDTSETLTTPDGRVLHNIPLRTIVKLVLNPAKGSNIKVEIGLPDAGKWNSRFLGMGNGGAAGHINSFDLMWPISGGYAVATTDMGTAPNPDSGIGNPEVWKDFGFRATHLMTVVSKQIIEAYYGKGPEYSYFVGGSTGGQQALQEAQRYPDDYDGIVASVPAHCRTPLHAYFLWNDQILNQCPFTKSQEANVIAAGNEYMAPRETPAIAGKFVSDPRCDGKDIEAVIALAMQKDSTLTPDHGEALRKLFDGPKHAVTGERIYNGIPFGSSFDGARGNLYLFHWGFGNQKKLSEINFGTDIDAYTSTLGPYLNAENPDLSRFQKRGGKLIMTSGTADSVVPYHASLDYYERVIEQFGSIESVQSFFNFYILPGMDHSCKHGIIPQENLLDVVRNWREKGIVPNMLHGKCPLEENVALEMPIYPYPTKTGWDTVISGYKPIDGPRGGVERVADRFRPAADE